VLPALAFEHADDAALCGVQHRADEPGLGAARAALPALYGLFACEVGGTEIVHVKPRYEQLMRTLKFSSANLS
jgi:hypothetical protein